MNIISEQLGYGHLFPRAPSVGKPATLRNCFITVAERDLIVHPSLTKRLVNHARPNDLTEDYAADWTIAQLREPAQKIADRIETLMNPSASSADVSA